MLTTLVTRAAAKVVAASISAPSSVFVVKAAEEGHALAKVFAVGGLPIELTKGYTTPDDSFKADIDLLYSSVFDIDIDFQTIEQVGTINLGVSGKSCVQLPKLVVSAFIVVFAVAQRRLP